MYKIIIIALALFVWSCASNPEIGIEVTNVEILEASLMELQTHGLLDANVSFSERAFQNEELFPDLQGIPEIIADFQSDYSSAVFLYWSNV